MGTQKSCLNENETVLMNTCVLSHWVSVFTLAVPIFRFTLKQNREYNCMSNRKPVFSYIMNIFFILDINNKM